MPATASEPLTVFCLGSARIIAPDTDRGYVLASQVLSGHRADAYAARRTAFEIDRGTLSADQLHDLKRHGWTFPV
jgi:hypothetical protein